MTCVRQCSVVDTPCLAFLVDVRDVCIRVHKPLVGRTAQPAALENCVVGDLKENNAQIMRKCINVILHEDLISSALK